MARVLAVASLPVAADCPDGFSRRYAALLPAVAARHDLRVVEAVPDHYRQASWPVPPGHVRPRGVRLPGGPGPRERVRRRAQLLAGRLPSRTVLLPDGALAGPPPDVLLTLGPDVVPAAVRAHPGPPRVHLLDEAWERTLLPDLRALPGWRGAWAARAEPARYRRLYRSMDRAGDVVLAIADHEREHLAPFFARARVEVLPHGLDPTYWAPVEADRDLDVVVVGALGQSRNLRPVLDLFAALDAPGLRWGLVGAETPAEVSALASDRVLVPGAVPDVRPWYARAKVVVVPSPVVSGVKTTLLEACAMARPVVAHAASARGVPVDVATATDAAGLAGRVREALADPAGAAARARAARDAVVAHRDSRRIAERLAEVVTDVVR